MAMMLGGADRGRRAGLRVVPAHAARGRFVAVEGRRGRGRRPQWRDQHVGLPRGRGLAPLAAVPRLGVRAAVLAGGEARPRLRGLHAAALGRRRVGAGVARRPTGRDHRRGAAGRLLEHLPVAARRRRAGRPGRRARSRSGSSPADASATRCASTATCSWTSRTGRWTGTTPCSAVPCAARRRGRCWRPGWDDFVVPGLGIKCVDENPWVTGAETCELAMALDALGEREQALRFFGEMQHLRSTEGRYWTGYVVPRRRALAGRVHDVHRGGGDPRRRRAQRHVARLGRHVRDLARARTSPRSVSGAAASRPPRSTADASRRPVARLAADPAQHAHRAEGLVLVEGAVVERAQVDLVRRAAAVRGVGEDVVDDEQAVAGHPAGPAVVVGVGRLVAVAAVDEQQRQRRAPVGRDAVRLAEHRDDLALEPGPLDRAPEDRQRVHPARCGVDEARRRGAPSRPGSPPSRGGGRR